MTLKDDMYGTFLAKESPLLFKQIRKRFWNGLI
jgi:hypothetical protein